MRCSSSEAQGLLKRILQFRPGDRPSINDILHDRWTLGEAAGINTMAILEEEEGGVRFPVAYLGQGGIGPRPHYSFSYVNCCAIARYHGELTGHEPCPSPFTPLWRPLCEILRTALKVSPCDFLP